MFNNGRNPWEGERQWDTGHKWGALNFATSSDIRHKNLKNIDSGASKFIDLLIFLLDGKRRKFLFDNFYVDNKRWGVLLAERTVV